MVPAFRALFFVVWAYIDEIRALIAQVAQLADVEEQGTRSVTAFPLRYGATCRRLPDSVAQGVDPLFLRPQLALASLPSI